MNFFRRLFGGDKVKHKVDDNRIAPARIPVKIPSAWNVGSRMSQDYIDAHTYAEKTCVDWDYYTPYMRFVPCRNGENKPAIFLKVGNDYNLWSKTTELRSLGWRWYASENYVVLRLSTYFEDAYKRLIGCGAPEHIYVVTNNAVEETGHKLVCSNFFDPSLDENDSLLESWAKMPGVTVIFFVMNNCENMNFVYYDLSPESKSCAIEQLREAKVEISKINGIVGSFEAACDELISALPYQSRWIEL
ncbi:MAG: hypothetical protein ACYC27_16540 [Armatimonadota bacterium]